MSTLKVVALAAAAALGTTAASAQTIGIVATAPGTLTHSSSTAVAKAISDLTKIQVRVIAQGASPQYSIAAGTGEFGLSNVFDTIFFLEGTGEYQGEGKHPELRVVGNLTPLLSTIWVRKDSSIKTPKDLKGKRIGSGYTAQKTILRIFEGQLATVGLTYKDVRGVPTANVATGADDFGASKTDAFTFALGAAKVKEIDAKVGGLRGLSFPETPAADAALSKILPGAYHIKINPSPQYDGILAPTNVTSFDFLLVTNVKVSEDIVYQVTKAVYNGHDIMVATFPPLRMNDPGKMAERKYAPLQYHEGAIKFYKEIGKWPPKV
jgi:TRAP transporter TAXI family solute receptor